MQQTITWTNDLNLCHHMVQESFCVCFQPMGYNVCSIKTGHSNLVSCFGLRMRALAKVCYRGDSRGKIPCQRPNPRAKTWHKIWMTGLNPNYETIPIPSLQNSQKSAKNPLVYLRSPAPFDSAVTPSARPPNFECTHLLLRSAALWRHNRIFDRRDNLNPQWMQAVNG